MTIGVGPLAEQGSRVTVRYTGYLNRGDVFQRHVVISFTVGERNAVAGRHAALRGCESVGGGDCASAHILRIGIAACRPSCRRARS